MAKKNIVTLEKMEVEDVAIDSITPNTYNPNRQSDREFELLCRSIEEDGFTQPIIVHKITKEIVDGEHRWRACKALGWTTVPAIFVEMTKEQMMIATLRHNRARGSEDISKAADVLRDIKNLGALDHASDSLLLDDVELKIMLDDIPQAELVLRNPDKKLTVQEVNDLIAKENAFNQQKIDQDKSTAKTEKSSIFTYILRYYQYEQRQVELTFTELPGESTAEKIIHLLNLYENDPEAQKYICQDDDHKWMGRAYYDEQRKKKG